MPNTPILFDGYAFTYSGFLLFSVACVFYFRGSISIGIRLLSFGVVRVASEAPQVEDDSRPVENPGVDCRNTDDTFVSSATFHTLYRDERQRVLDRYRDTLKVHAVYYDPPETYYCGRAATGAPRGGYGPPYEFYSGAWRDGYGHDVTNPPFYARDDETGHWHYSWPGRGRGAAW
ncbi:hypothetical protein DV738_g2837, partial [Chaetothyriales sp. CBS 135597]